MNAAAHRVEGNAKVPVLYRMQGTVAPPSVMV